MISKVNSALEQEGLGYVIGQAPHYIKHQVRSKLSNSIYTAYNPDGTLSRSDMISYCEDNNQILYYGSHDQFNIKPPATGSIPDSFDKLIGVRGSPKSFLCELNEIQLIGERAIPRMRNGKFILEEMGTDSMLKSRVMNTFGSLNTIKKLREISNLSSYEHDNHYSEPLINLVPRHGAEHNDYINYGHWLLEDLPRLRAVEQYSRKTDQNPTLLIKNNPPSWVTDTLDLLGFSPSQCVEWSNHKARIDTMLIPKLSYIHSFGAEFQPSDRAWVAEQMKSRVDLTKPEEFSKRVFVSRQGQDRRKIINFDEVINLLHDYGFDSIRPEEISIEEQIRLFDQAEVIIGAFGAGLMNMIFAHDASLVEIKPYKTAHTVYYIIANECNLQYDLIHGEPLENNQSDSHKDSNIIVDITKLTDVIENII